METASMKIEVTSPITIYCYSDSEGSLVMIIIVCGVWTKVR